MYNYTQILEQVGLHINYRDGPTCLSEMLHEETEPLGPGEQVMFEDRVATRTGKVHAQSVLFLCEPCTLCK